MQFDLSAISEAARSKLLHSSVVPRPIAWVSSLSAAGSPNLAPFSFFNIFSTDPAIVGLGIGRRSPGEPKHTARNILETSEFVINLVDHANRDAMNMTGADVDDDIDESVLAGIEMIASASVKPRRVASSPIAFECVLHQSINLTADRHLILGRILTMHIDDSMLAPTGDFHVATPQLDLIGRMHGAGWYTRTDHLFQMPRIKP